MPFLCWFPSHLPSTWISFLKPSNPLIQSYGGCQSLGERQPGFAVSFNQVAALSRISWPVPVCGATRAAAPSGSRSPSRCHSQAGSGGWQSRSLRDVVLGPAPVGVCCQRAVCVQRSWSTDVNSSSKFLCLFLSVFFCLIRLTASSQWQKRSLLHQPPNSSPSGCR